MASPKKRSKIGGFLSAVGLIKKDKPRVTGTIASETNRVRRTSIPDEIKTRARSVSSTVENKWRELRTKYSEDIRLSQITNFILSNPDQAKFFSRSGLQVYFLKETFVKNTQIILRSYIDFML